jgi:hypothetical protein
MNGRLLVVNNEVAAATSASAALMMNPMMIPGLGSDVTAIHQLSS